MQVLLSPDVPLVTIRPRLDRRRRVVALELSYDPPDRARRLVLMTRREPPSHPSQGEWANLSLLVMSRVTARA